MRPVERTIPAGGTLALDSPIRLVIAAHAHRSTDGFTWTIAHDPAGLTFALTLVGVPAPYDQPCRTPPS